MVASVRVIVLVQQYPTDPWASIRRAQDETWVSRSALPVFHYHGQTNSLSVRMNRLHARVRNSRVLRPGLLPLDRLMMLPVRGNEALPRVSVYGRTLLVDVLDSFLTAGLKFLSALKFVQDNYDFDFIYRTNTSSYIETERLRELAAQSQETSVYAGPIVRTPRGDFVSGSSILLSRDLVSATVQEHSHWPHELYEDVALGAVMRKLRVSPQETPSCIVSDEAAAVALGDQALRNSFHFRCKAVDPSGVRIDSSVMRLLDRRLQSLDWSI